MAQLTNDVNLNDGINTGNLVLASTAITGGVSLPTNIAADYSNTTAASAGITLTNDASLTAENWTIACSKLGVTGTITDPNAGDTNDKFNLTNCYIISSEPRRTADTVVWQNHLAGTSTLTDCTWVFNNGRQRFVADDVIILNDVTFTVAQQNLEASYAAPGNIPQVEFVITGIDPAASTLNNVTFGNGCGVFFPENFQSSRTAFGVWGQVNSAQRPISVLFGQVNGYSLFNEVDISRSNPNTSVTGGAFDRYTTGAQTGFNANSGLILINPLINTDGLLTEIVSNFAASTSVTVANAWSARWRDPDANLVATDVMVDIPLTQASITGIAERPAGGFGTDNTAIHGSFGVVKTLFNADELATGLLIRSANGMADDAGQAGQRAGINTGERDPNFNSPNRAQGAYDAITYNAWSYTHTIPYENTIPTFTVTGLDGNNYTMSGSRLDANDVAFFAGQSAASPDVASDTINAVEDRALNGVDFATAQTLATNGIGDLRQAYAVGKSLYYTGRQSAFTLINSTETNLNAANQDINLAGSSSTLIAGGTFSLDTLAELDFNGMTISTTGTLASFREVTISNGTINVSQFNPTSITIGDNITIDGGEVNQVVTGTFSTGSTTFENTPTLNLSGDTDIINWNVTNRFTLDSSDAVTVTLSHGQASQISNLDGETPPPATQAGTVVVGDITFSFPAEAARNRRLIVPSTFVGRITVATLNNSTGEYSDIQTPVNYTGTHPSPVMVDDVSIRGNADLVKVVVTTGVSSIFNRQTIPFGNDPGTTVDFDVAPQNDVNFAAISGQTVPTAYADRDILVEDGGTGIAIINIVSAEQTEANSISPGWNSALTARVFAESKNDADYILEILQANGNSDWITLTPSGTVTLTGTVMLDGTDGIARSTGPAGTGIQYIQGVDWNNNQAGTDVQIVLDSNDCPTVIVYPNTDGITTTQVQQTLRPDLSTINNNIIVASVKPAAVQRAQQNNMQNGGKNL